MLVLTVLLVYNLPAKKVLAGPVTLTGGALTFVTLLLVAGIVVNVQDENSPAYIGEYYERFKNFIASDSPASKEIVEKTFDDASQEGKIPVSLLTGLYVSGSSTSIWDSLINWIKTDLIPSSAIPSAGGPLLNLPVSWVNNIYPALNSVNYGITSAVNPFSPTNSTYLSKYPDGIYPLTSFSSTYSVSPVIRFLTVATGVVGMEWREIVKDSVAFAREGHAVKYYEFTTMDGYGFNQQPFSNFQSLSVKAVTESSPPYGQTALSFYDTISSQWAPNGTETNDGSLLVRSSNLDKFSLGVDVSSYPLVFRINGMDSIEKLLGASASAVALSLGLDSVSWVRYPDGTEKLVAGGLGAYSDALPVTEFTSLLTGGTLANEDWKYSAGGAAGAGLLGAGLGLLGAGASVDNEGVQQLGSLYLPSPTSLANAITAQEIAALTGGVAIDTSTTAGVVTSASTAVGVKTGTIAEALEITTPLINGIPLTLWNVFPFSIPFDLIALISVFSAPPETPKFETVIKLPYVGDYPFTIDLEPFETVAAFIRNFQVAIFIMFLIKISRNVIKG